MCQNDDQMDPNGQVMSSVNFVNWILNSNVPGPLDFTIVVPSVSPGPNFLTVCLAGVHL